MIFIINKDFGQMKEYLFMLKIIVILVTSISK